MTILEYKNSPNVQRILNEIGELVTPYVKQSAITLSDNNYGEPSFTFFDHEGNEIKVFFMHIKDKEYEAEFSVNGNSFQSLKTSTSHYFKMLSTVVGVVNKFLKEYDPDSLMINGVDKNTDHEGQKNYIYRAYAKAMIDQTHYRVANLPKGFGLVK